ncbi:SMP-30/gluconolactonase/LRE family protein [Parendozoicomonas sp. Alg238-R29]|uniref:SMP-30/gluconolactonase/LRE family protein n=1 Tax=Parendozoicomonas sp. Alg238-R29 TaxID=2993446 RepID=UPI00248DF41D|nr:SMP-30/gluconolactonase/LRE family protein [Parendozoicomonas sp. Alg238-R29]
MKLSPLRLPPLKLPLKFCRILPAVCAAMLLSLPVKSLALNSVHWAPPKTPEMVGKLSPNTVLSGITTIDTTDCVGPEDVDKDSQGRIYGGCDDGRIIRFLKDGTREVFANTGGRPLGLHFDAQDNLIVADSWKGLLSINPGGQIKVLTTEAEGIPFAFTDDLDIASNGTIYFSDASSKYNQPDYILDLLEGRPYGRLLSYSPTTGDTKVLLKDLYFANGIALSQNEDFVLVNETYRYQVTRYWLKDGPNGEKAGTSDIFIDNLPGLPDGISSSRDGTFWVAMATPRKKVVDWGHKYPWFKNLVASLPRFMWPGPTHYGLVVALNEQGKVTGSLHDPSGDTVSVITSVQQVGDELLLGTLTNRFIGRMPVPTFTN